MGDFKPDSTCRLIQYLQMIRDALAVSTAPIKVPPGLTAPKLPPSPCLPGLATAQMNDLRLMLYHAMDTGLLPEIPELRCDNEYVYWMSLAPGAYEAALKVGLPGTPAGLGGDLAWAIDTLIKVADQHARSLLKNSYSCGESVQPQTTRSRIEVAANMALNEQSVLQRAIRLFEQFPKEYPSRDEHCGVQDREALADFAAIRQLMARSNGVLTLRMEGDGHEDDVISHVAIFRLASGAVRDIPFMDQVLAQVPRSEKARKPARSVRRITYRVSSADMAWLRGKAAALLEAEQVKGRMRQGGGRNRDHRRATPRIPSAKQKKVATLLERFTPSEVASQLDISTQAVQKHKAAYERNLAAIVSKPRSVRANQKLPEGERGEVLIEDADE